MSTNKPCQQCGKILQGRVDKKFCDDQCRSNFNNHVNSDVSSWMRNINYILRKNRRLIAAILPRSGKAKINRDKLIELGFDFRYFTHYHYNQKGRIFKVCYDYGYLNLESREVLLMQCKGSSPIGIKDTNKRPLKKKEKMENDDPVEEFNASLMNAE